MSQRNPDQASAAINAARLVVAKKGSTVHEDSMWDVSGMALHGLSQQSMVQRL